MSDPEKTSAELQSPSGWKAKLTGAQVETVVVCLTIVLSILAGTGFLAWSGLRDKEQYLSAHQTTQALLNNVVTNQSVILSELRKSNTATAEQGEAIVYVLTLDQRQREALKLTMPPALRKQFNNR